MYYNEIRKELRETVRLLTAMLPKYGACGSEPSDEVKMALVDGYVMGLAVPKLKRLAEACRLDYGVPSDWLEGQTVNMTLKVLLGVG